MTEAATMRDTGTLLDRCEGGEVHRRRDGLIRQGIAHIAAGRFTQADSDLAAALRLDPSSRAAAFQYALSAGRRRDWNEVLRRWQIASVRQPDNPDVAIGQCEALRELGAIEDALDVIKDALVAFSCAPILLPSLARLARAQHDVPRAAACWSRFLAHAPDDLGALHGLGTAWLEGAQYAAAAEVFSRAAALHPDDAWTMVLLARARTFLGEWDAAFALWSRLKAEHGSNRVAQENFRELMHLLRLSMADAAADPLAAAGARLWAAPPAAEFRRWEQDLEQGWLNASQQSLMLQFESLGAGCEFGLVQRHYNTEPLGLLRWATIQVPALVAALDSRFAGMGAPDNTELDIFEGAEYAVVDRRSRMRSHTRIFVGQAAPETVLAQQCKRLRYLKEKLMQDLAAGDKILVYSQRPGISDREIDRLYAAVAGYGPNYLLCVRLADAAHPGGSVERAGGRRLVGYIDHLWAGGAAPISYPVWLRICQQAADLRRAIAAAEVPD